MAVDGHTREVKARVLEWCGPDDPINKGRPLVSVPGNFAFYARRWTRMPTQKCECPICKKHIGMGKTPPHGIGASAENIRR